ncbi:malonate decarboxylase holo-[acyl-carrier-protein] synthase [Mesorhizobium sanjuanii]|uniref:Malonate decarboxylase holo-[acyl-carrier-protein] synthase n=1 Tax=Mesorhizobium sanjuanii TaxID=2037900 RepID=A0A2A6FLW0_9HYPH|nr:malonate decarboxylase holo-[acyl-carrier-protein] synthase [Mesorhizobium sanjuanii]PDQ22722.1 malonate decarboxylase holo-[acyl-carrier-protein] synthase [Mesorhizobium sanjuanii]
MPSQAYSRHDLLRVDPEAWRRILLATDGLGPLAAEPRRLVEGWAGRGWPVIVRRSTTGDDESAIAVGLPLPPALGKLRLGLAIPAGCVVTRVAALRPAQAMRSAPAHLRPQLAAAADLGARLGLRPAVFGALLWQHLTGLDYLRPTSDMDLIWPMPCGGVLEELLDGLAALDDAGPARLDGEIILGKDEGVNWRELRGELARPGGTVLVKSMHGTELRCARHLFV